MRIVEFILEAIYTTFLLFLGMAIGAAITDTQNDNKQNCKCPCVCVAETEAGK